MNPQQLLRALQTSRTNHSVRVGQQECHQERDGIAALNHGAHQVHQNPEEAILAAAVIQEGEVRLDPEEEDQVDRAAVEEEHRAHTIPSA